MAESQSTYDDELSDYDSGIRYVDEDEGTTGRRVYNIKLPMTDADEAEWIASLGDVKAKVEPFKPDAEDENHKLHISAEDLEVIELVLAYAKAHPTELTGTT